MLKKSNVVDLIMLTTSRHSVNEISKIHIWHTQYIYKCSSTLANHYIFI